MTATPQNILWVAINLIGMFVWGWLAIISWERRLAILLDKRSLLRKTRLRNVNKQLRGRALGFVVCLAGVVVGILPMFGVIIPMDGTQWIFIFAATIITLFAAKDLWGEFRAS